MSDLLLDTASRLFAAHCGKAVLDKAEAGEFPAALWRAIEEAGLATALLAEERGGPGVATAEALAMLRVAGRHAAPVPFAEALLAGWLFGNAGLDMPEGPLSIAPVNRRDELTLERRSRGGWRLAGTATRVPWGRHAKAVAVLAGTMVARVDQGSAKVADERNVAGEPRDTLSVALDLPADAVGETNITRDELYAMGAAARTLQIAGALAYVLEITTSYAQQRVQFGRPIGKFQAVQQNMAVLAGHAAAASAAADMAAEAAENGFDAFVIGAAKLRAGEAASVGAAIAHQVHGAIGFTHEHALNHSTRRLWSWRDEFGNEADWGRRVAATAAEAGADRLWATITGA